MDCLGSGGGLIWAYMLQQCFFGASETRQPERLGHDSQNFSNQSGKLDHRMGMAF